MDGQHRLRLRGRTAPSSFEEVEEGQERLERGGGGEQSEAELDRAAGCPGRGWDSPVFYLKVSRRPLGSY